MTAGARSGRAQKMSVLVANSIAESIVKGGQRAGDRLPTEAQMMDSYQIGRATLREALRLLEAQGVLEIRVGAGGGPFVAEPKVEFLTRNFSMMLRMSETSMREVLQARLIIEPEVARLAAINRTDAQLEALRANCRAHVSVSRVGGTEWFDLNREFHTLLATASNNRPLTMIWGALSDIADGHEAGVRYPPNTLADAVTAHARILDAVEAGNAAEAASAMTRHLQAAADFVERYYPYLYDTAVPLYQQPN